MDEIRLNRVRAQIKDEITVLINQGLGDDRIPFVTVSDVLLTKDGKQATIMVSIVNTSSDDDENRHAMALCLDGLNSAKTFLRKRIAQQMSLRIVPELFFKEDKGLANALRVNELLKQIENEKQNPKT